MSRHETRLANGLRVVSHHMPNLETVSMGIWVGVGARHETVGQQDISHLLEHMAFKGTKRRSAKDIAEEIEAVGGELNAATSLETTAYSRGCWPPTSGSASTSWPTFCWTRAMPKASWNANAR